MEFRNLRDIKEVSKAYTEGVYSDTPLNRRMGRVGLTYKQYSEKTDTSKNIEKQRVINILQGSKSYKEIKNSLQNKKVTFEYGDKKQVKGKIVDVLIENLKINGKNYKEVVIHVTFDKPVRINNYTYDSADFFDEDKDFNFGNLIVSRKQDEEIKKEDEKE